MVNASQIAYCGDFTRVQAFSKPPEPKVAVKLIDDKNKREHLFVIDNKNEWEGMDQDMQVNLLRGVLLTNGARHIDHAAKPVLA